MSVDPYERYCKDCGYDAYDCDCHGINCEWCNSTISADDYVHDRHDTPHGTFCDDCFSNTYIPCRGCGERFFIDDAYTITLMPSSHSPERKKFHYCAKECVGCFP